MIGDKLSDVCAGTSAVVGTNLLYGNNTLLENAPFAGYTPISSLRDAIHWL